MDYQWFQLALHQMRGVKPPRQKRGNQRRLAVIPVFEVVGVEPSPLFEWRIFGTFVSGQKYKETPSQRRNISRHMFAVCKPLLSLNEPFLFIFTRENEPKPTALQKLPLRSDFCEPRRLPHPQSRFCVTQTTVPQYSPSSDWRRLWRAGFILHKPSLSPKQQRCNWNVAP